MPALLLAAVACDSGPGGPGGGLKLSALQPDTCHAGQPLAHALHAKVTDQDGAPASGATVAFALTSGTGALGANSAKTDASGTAQVGFSCGSTGADLNGNAQVVAKVQASLAGASGSPAEFSVFGLWGPLERFTGTYPVPFIDPGCPGCGVDWVDSMPVVLPDAFALVVYPVDQFGNGMKLSTVEWTPLPGSGSFAASATPASGWVGAVNTWTPGPQVGFQGVELRSPDFPTVRDTVVIHTLAAPLVIQIISPPLPITATVSVMLTNPIVVSVTTAEGQPFPNADVRFRTFPTRVTPQNGSFTAPPCTGVPGPPPFFFPTEATGLASACFTPDTLAGSLSVAVGIIGRTPGLGEVPFSLLAGPPAKAANVFGSGQIGTTGTTLGIPLGFTLQDRYGNLVPNQTVTWTVIAGGGSMASPTTTTDAAGGTSNAWTLGPTVGTQTVTATAGAVTVTFTAQAS